MESDLEGRYWNAQMKVLILQARSLKHFSRYLREALEMNILAREQSKHRLVGLCVQLLCIVVGFQGSSKKRSRREEMRTTTHDEQVVLNKEQAVRAFPEKRKHEGETEAKERLKKEETIGVSPVRGETKLQETKMTLAEEQVVLEKKQTVKTSKRYHEEETEAQKRRKTPEQDDPEKRQTGQALPSRRGEMDEAEIDQMWKALGEEQPDLKKKQVVEAPSKKRAHGDERETEAKKRKKTPAEEEVAHKKEHDAQAPSDKSREEGEEQVNLT